MSWKVQTEMVGRCRELFTRSEIEEMEGRGKW
jgi:hypothetical protein